MRFRRVPENLLSSTGRIAVINALLRSPNKVWTGSELSRAAGVTPRWAIATLRALESEGVVHPEWAPPAMRWTVNQKHLLVQLLASVIDIDSRAQSALMAHLGKAVAKARPLKALLFGSTARGEESPGSDIDVLVVVKDAQARTRAREILAQEAGPFYWRFGNRLSPIVLTQREFDKRQGEGFVKQALEHGIWIRGGPPSG